MKFCSYEIEGRRSYGAEATDGTIVDLRDALGADAPVNLEDLIERAASDADYLEKVRNLATDRKGGLDPQTLSWLPPLRRPGKILGVAINNRIGQEVAFRPFANPAFFLKPNTSLVGHGHPVVVRESYSVTHPEPELAIIIGRGGKNIKESEALSHIFGYSVMNDITSPGLKAADSIECLVPAGVSASYAGDLSWRKVLNDEHQRSIYLTYHAISKGCDTFGAFGPWLVTADEVNDPNNLKITSYDDGELVFEDSTANLVFPVERVISHISQYMTLEAGDVIHCGTAMKAVAGGKYPMPSQWDIAKESGAMRIAIENVGILENPVEIKAG